MTKFEKVKKALEERTYGTSNYITLTTEVYAGSSGKYATRNMITKNVSQITYKTLDEVINEYELEI